MVVAVVEEEEEKEDMVNMCRQVKVRARVEHLTLCWSMEEKPSSVVMEYDYVRLEDQS